jgi:hypothetical protein
MGSAYYRLQPGSTKSVNGLPRHRNWEAREQTGHPGYIPIVFARLVGAAEDHVIDQSRIYPGTLHQRLNDVRREVVRAKTIGM